MGNEKQYEDGFYWFRCRFGVYLCEIVGNAMISRDDTVKGHGYLNDSEKLGFEILEKIEVPEHLKSK